MQTALYEADGKLFIESAAIRVVVDPAHGGKICSFRSQRTGKEFFFQDGRTKFSGEGYSEHDISGYDECFPIVDICEYPDGKRGGMSLADHGYLWQGAWEARIVGDRVLMHKDIPELQCRFHRTCSSDTPRSLTLDYAIENYGDEPLKYVYSAHPMLAADEQTRLVLPREIRKMFVLVALNVPSIEDKTWITWPPPGEGGLEAPFSGERRSVVKLFSDRLTEGMAAVYHPDVGEGLQFEFGTETLSYLGVLIQQGYDLNEDGTFRGQLFLGLEPTTGIGDELACCASTGTLRELPPAQDVQFRIRLKLMNLQESTLSQMEGE